MENSLSDRVKNIFNTEENNTGYSGGKFNTAQENMIGGAVNAGAGIVSTGIGAAFQSSAIKDAQKENRDMFNQDRAANIAQSNVSNSLKKKAVSQEERSMKLQQKQQDYDLRINRWLNKIQQSVESQQNLVENSEQLFSLLNNENLRTAIMKSFG